jgi:2,3-bisphosphoglycerate-independent phosphoglycerate mutase
MDLDQMTDLLEPADTTISLLVLDGVGGLPGDDGLTELQAAETPNLDALAAESACGLQVPVGPGIIPGSGPGHLSLFGYDPLEYSVGRGVLSALGIGFDLKSTDVAARGNFCTVDDQGRVTDRRAGRISTETNRELCDKLRSIDIDGVDIHIETVKEHRFLLVLRGEGLSGELEDTDPQETGVEPHDSVASRPDQTDAVQTADLVAEFLRKARETLADASPANMLLLRGFAKRPDWPTFQSAYNLDAACIASYPMYRGVARLVGMDVLECEAELESKFEVAAQHWDDYDYFFIHEKQTDSSGEDGDFERKVKVIEEADAALPTLLDQGPDVLTITGDHSTPSTMAQHSWHPVPVLMHAQHCRRDKAEAFNEIDCLDGALGPRLPGPDLMPLALAHAGRLTKYGA